MSRCTILISDGEVKTESDPDDKLKYKKMKTFSLKDAIAKKTEQYVNHKYVSIIFLFCKVKLRFVAT